MNNLPEDAAVLRIYLGERHKYGHHPLYEAIVLKLRELGFEGATVLRGAMGYGTHQTLHTAKILQLSMDLPIIIEVISPREKIESFLPTLETMMSGGITTIEDLKVVRYPSKSDATN